MQQYMYANVCVLCVRCVIVPSDPVTKFFSRFAVRIDPLSRCMDDRLTPFYTKAYEFNARIQHFSSAGDDTTSRAYAINQRNIPYIGNGLFGLETHDDARFYVKYGRHLSQAIDYRPVVRATHRPAASDDFAEPLNTKQAVVVDYLNGIVHKFQCFGSDFFIAHEFYGKYHRK